MDSMAHISWHLNRREWVWQIKSYSMLVIGPLISFTGPLALSSIFWFALNRWGILGQFQWMELFVTLSVVMIPLLIHQEIRTQGRYRADLSDTIPMTPGRVHGMTMAFGAAAGLLVNARVTSSIFVEVFLIGPKLLLGGLELLRLSKPFIGVDHHRTATLFSFLLCRDSGVELDQLYQDNEQRNDLLPNLAYLSFYRWIGAAKNWDRVWLSSESRRLFIA